MSRSRKKIAKIGICNGNNTEYYRLRSHATRVRNRQMMRHLFANYTLDYIADNINNVLPIEISKYDSWDEPTDGSITARNFQDYCSRPWCRYIKSRGAETYESTRLWFEKNKRK